MRVYSTVGSTNDMKHMCTIRYGTGEDDTRAGFEFDFSVRTTNVYTSTEANWTNLPPAGRCGRYGASSEQWNDVINLFGLLIFEPKNGKPICSRFIDCEPSDVSDDGHLACKIGVDYFKFDSNTYV